MANGKPITTTYFVLKTPSIIEQLKALHKDKDNDGNFIYTIEQENPETKKKEQHQITITMIEYEQVIQAYDKAENQGNTFAIKALFYTKSDRTVVICALNINDYISTPIPTIIESKDQKNERTSNTKTLIKTDSKIIVPEKTPRRPSMTRRTAFTKKYKDLLDALQKYLPESLVILDYVLEEGNFIDSNKILNAINKTLRGSGNKEDKSAHQNEFLESMATIIKNHLLGTEIKPNRPKDYLQIKIRNICLEYEARKNLQNKLLISNLTEQINSLKNKKLSVNQLTKEKILTLEAQRDKQVKEYDDQITTLNQQIQTIESKKTKVKIEEIEQPKIETTNRERSITHTSEEELYATQETQPHNRNLRTSIDMTAENELPQEIRDALKSVRALSSQKSPSNESLSSYTYTASGETTPVSQSPSLSTSPKSPNWNDPGLSDRANRAPNKTNTSDNIKRSSSFGNNKSIEDIKAEIEEIEHELKSLDPNTMQNTKKLLIKQLGLLQAQLPSSTSILDIVNPKELDHIPEARGSTDQLPQSGFNWRNSIDQDRLSTQFSMELPGSK